LITRSAAAVGVNHSEMKRL